MLSCTEKTASLLLGVRNSSQNRGMHARYCLSTIIIRTVCYDVMRTAGADAGPATGPLAIHSHSSSSSSISNTSNSISKTGSHIKRLTSSDDYAGSSYVSGVAGGLKGARAWLRLLSALAQAAPLVCEQLQQASSASYIAALEVGKAIETIFVLRSNRIRHTRSNSL